MFCFLVVLVCCLCWADTYCRAEHMLFLGTEKYPDEASYKVYLDRHGGSSNAYTAAENTN